MTEKTNSMVVIDECSLNLNSTTERRKHIAALSSPNKMNVTQKRPETVRSSGKETQQTNGVSNEN